ncbi:hypothetical protein BBJ28_00019377 [Nothophytophthora sp. Chile5]|nr:hypothetical protein BBJ28_00019377 [Nothophytophthora sp. Chile5]
MVTAPGVLSNPSDIGIHQAGIAETIVQAVEACPEELHVAFYANILLVGGNIKFRNFQTRLERDLRTLVLDEFEIGVHTPKKKEEPQEVSVLQSASRRSSIFMQRSDVLSASSASSASAASAAIWGASSSAAAAAPSASRAVNSVTIGGVAHADASASGGEAATSSRTVAVRSIRDAEQGIYEYLEEQHPLPQARDRVRNANNALALRTVALPVRLSGWLWRREGLFRKYKRRFCVFRAEHAALFVFSDDDTVNGKLLRRLVLTRVTLTSRTDRSFVAQGYLQDRELHKKASDSMARRASSLKRGALPGDRQRFYLPEEERFKAVSAKACSVWTHCFKYYMRSYPLRRQRAEAEAEGGDDVVYESEESAENAVVSEDDAAFEPQQDAVDPDFVFEDAVKTTRRYSLPGGLRSRGGSGLPIVSSASSKSKSKSKQTSRRRGRAGKETEAAGGKAMPPVQFDQDHGPELRITSTYRPSSGFEDEELAATVMSEVAQAQEESTTQEEEEEEASSSSSSDVTQSQTRISSIWEDEELLSHRVDFDSIVKKEKLASGAAGEVWRALYRSQDVVVKNLKDEVMPVARSSGSGDLGSMRRRRRALLAFVEEIRILSRLEHNRIVLFRGVAWTMERDLLLVMEYLPRGDLCTFLGAVKRQEENSTGSSSGSHGSRDRFHSIWTWTKVQWRLAIDIAEGLVYLHSLDPPLVHGDLKSRNVLLRNDFRAKLADFGLSRYLPSSDDDENDGAAAGEDAAGREESFRGSESSRVRGTGRWMAPELLTSGAQVSQTADVYAFGIVLSEIDTCEVPFHEREKQVAALPSSTGSSAGEGSGEDGCSRSVAMSEDVLVHQIVAEGWRPSFRVTCPDAIKQLALDCLAPDPKARPSSLVVAHRLRKAAAQRERPETIAAQAKATASMRIR